jgi:hypothetical protein
LVGEPSDDCESLKVGDAKAFCSPVPTVQEWMRFVRGSTVLVVKPARPVGRKGYWRDMTCFVSIMIIEDI